MNFLYPRVIQLRRVAVQTGEGIAPYGGHTQAGETTVASGIACSIQERREGQRSVVGLPGDGTKPTWYVFIPRSQLALGVVKDRDIVVDDQAERYQVIANYWDSLGYRLTVEKLEA